MDHVVVDIETKRAIVNDADGNANTDQVGMSCGVIYEYDTDRYRLYGPDEEERMRSRLLAADRITGFNIWRFDLPVLWGLPAGQRVTELVWKTDDLLVRIWNAAGYEPFGKYLPDMHGRFPLKDVALMTLRRTKIAGWRAAVDWYEEGRIAAALNYCADDVALERDLGQFIDKYAYILYGERPERLSVDRDWSLPFRVHYVGGPE